MELKTFIKWIGYLVIAGLAIVGIFSLAGAGTFG